MKCEFSSVVRNWPADIEHLNRLNTEKWQEFPKNIIARYSQLKLILKRLEIKTTDSDIYGRIVKWGHTLIGQEIQNLSWSFALLLFMKLSSDEVQSGLASRSDAWRVVEKFRHSRKEII